MMKTILTSALLVASLLSQAQPTVRGARFQLSPEEMREVLLQKSRQQRTKGWISLLGGPALTITGMVLHQDRQNSHTYNAGYIIGAAGVVTTVMAVPLLLAAGKNKRKARLLLKEESTGFIFKNQPASLPAIGIRISL